MKLVIQRVSHAEVEVEGKVVGRIAQGMLVLLGAERGDTGATAAEAARKVAGLRIFEDPTGKMNRDLAAVGGSVLAVSQFTLAADLSRGRRPGFDHALAPDAARELYDGFVRSLETLGVPVQVGVFGAMMNVSLTNAGPATFILDLPAEG